IGSFVSRDRELSCAVAGFVVQITNRAEKAVRMDSRIECFLGIGVQIVAADWVMWMSMRAGMQNWKAKRAIDGTDLPSVSSSTTNTDLSRLIRGGAGYCDR